MDLKLLLNWRLHLTVIVTSLFAEWVGIARIAVGPGTLLLLPLLYAFVIGVLLNPHLFSSMEKLIPKPVSQASGPIILIAILPFIAKFGSTIGPALEQISWPRAAASGA